MPIIDREQILSRYSGEEKTIIARTLDTAESVLKNYQPDVTGFYDPYHTGLVFSVLKQIPDLECAADGGYPNAERTRILVFPDYLTGDQVESNLAFLQIEGNFKMAAVNHRDYLGSLMSLGIKRDKLGDIIVRDKGAQLVADADVALYIRANLTKIGGVKVAVTEITRDEIKPPEPNIKIINAVVASMRLDAVAAAGYGTSRSKLVKEISAERLSINWCSNNNPAAAVKEGDILSMRGRGRVKVAEVKGQTKSGRIALVLHRYI